MKWMPYVATFDFCCSTLKGYINTIRIQHTPETFVGWFGSLVSAAVVVVRHNFVIKKNNKMKSRRNRIALDSLNEWGSGGGREHIRCTNDEEWHESSLIINSVDKTGTKGNGTIWSGFFVIYFGFVFFSVCVWNSHWNGCSRKMCCVCVYLLI